MAKRRGESKYALYEQAVQDPARDVRWLSHAFEREFGREPLLLREDFCGTFRLACEWVKLGERRSAIALDLDPDPLRYGKENHRKKLSASQRKRVRALKKNVLSVTNPKADLVIAYNFSFNVFKQRKQLVDYLRHCLRSLKGEGMVVFEIAGGPGMIQKSKERKTIFDANGKAKFTYVWDQKSYDPVTGDALYAIHFKFPDKPEMRDAFVYDWRLWSITEVKDAMLDAGFDESFSFWDKSSRRDGTSELERADRGKNDWAYVTCVGAVKRGRR